MVQTYAALKLALVWMLIGVSVFVIIDSLLKLASLCRMQSNFGASGLRGVPPCCQGGGLELFTIDWRTSLWLILTAWVG